MIKKFQIFCLILVGVVFQATESKAISNEGLYKACKSYTEAGFKISTMQHTLCMAYTRGLLDMARLLCQSAEFIDEKDANFWLRSLGAGNDAPKQLDAIIQSYVNYMASHPEEWQEEANVHLVRTLQSLAPCK